MKPNVNDVHSANESRVVILYPFQAAKCSAENILSLTLSACCSIQVIIKFISSKREIFASVLSALFVWDNYVLSD